MEFKFPALERARYESCEGTLMTLSIERRSSELRVYLKFVGHTESIERRFKAMPQAIVDMAPVREGWEQHCPADCVKCLNAVSTI